MESVDQVKIMLNAGKMYRESLHNAHDGFLKKPRCARRVQVGYTLLRAQFFIPCKADLHDHQYFNRGFAFSSCLNGTFP